MPDVRPILRIRGVSIPRAPPASFDLYAGECATVVGPSGAGKSWLLRQIADLDPGQGYVELDGIPRSDMRGFE